MAKYQKNLKKYLDDLSKKKPSPGGGSAAALSFCLGIALIEKALNYSQGKVPEFKKEIISAGKLRRGVIPYIDKDGEIFEKVIKAKGQKRVIFLNKSNELLVKLGNACLDGFCLSKRVESGIKKSIISDFYIGMHFMNISLGAVILNLEANSEILGENNKYVDIFRQKLEEVAI